MAKILSEKERKLQKKLIPLNIFVCILSLVAAASLMFGQIFCIDVGKILRSESTIAFVDETVGNIVDESTSGTEEGNQVDFKPVVSMIIKNVLGSAEGAVNVSAFNSAKVAFASGDEKAQKVMDELFFGENAMVTKLIDSIVDNVANMFKTKEGKQLMEEIVVTTITASLVANLSEEDAAKITKEISEITATLHEFDNAKNRDEAAAAADKFIDHLDEVLGESFKEADGEAIKDYVLTMYDDAAAETDGKNEDFSVEAMIAVTVSKNVDLSSFDLGGLFDSWAGEPSGSTHKRIVEDEIGGTETGSGEDEGGNETDPDNPEPVDPDPDNPDPEPVDPDPDNPDPEPEPTPGEDDQVICTTYEELLAQMGLDDTKTEELKTTLRGALQNFVQTKTEPIAEYFQYYGYIFYGMLAFIVPWLILFLFAFFHTFAKNKRFMMWYVKLYSWIPGVISLVFIFAPKLINFITNYIAMDESILGIINSIIGGISSQLWISGICYILLWLVSIFWAFPIKHKIRKERKLAKQSGSSFGGGPAGGAPNGENYYQPPYGNNNNPYGNNSPYGSNNPYGNNSPYGNSNPYGNNGAYGNNNYGGNSYGVSPYGQSPYGGNTYDNPYGGILDQDAYDHGGFNAPFTGSYYGFDEDDF